ncbi:MerR family transcriptional regulator [Phytomonospora sp. NPDC050363]|uniref:helix-turn-helix domain-containing protein n=1 Tax=Phytomonospora sp. NPDC050363 TaxID=3155642 RepID=UPI0033DBB159
MTVGLLKIGELAARAGVSPRTIDHYTQMGLLAPDARTPSGYRLYAAEAVERVHLIQRLEGQGLSLTDVGGALSKAPADLQVLLAKVGADLTALEDAPVAGDPQLHGLIGAIVERAHSLLITAIELGGAVPPP